jgi:competence/damage-inducible protein CinA-like protein
MRAEIVSIGTELLLGEIIDTNAAHIAQQLRTIGLDLLYKTTVGDNEQRIASVIEHALGRSDVVITSGGLGPTVDDVTREAIARATNSPLEFRQELLDQIADRFRRFGTQMSENNRRQAMVPTGAQPIENPVGTAPIFILKTQRGVVITLPGVPREMKYLLEHSILPWLAEFAGSPSIIKSIVLRTAGIGESQIDSRIGDMMTAANPTIGLAAHSGQTDIRITAKASTEADAMHLIQPVEEEVRRRLHQWIYGSDNETIEQVIVGLLNDRQAALSAAEIGTNNRLRQRIDAIKNADRIQILSEASPEIAQASNQAEGLEGAARQLSDQTRLRGGTEFGLAVIIGTQGTAIAVTAEGKSRARAFGWSTERTDGDIWATTHALAMLRRMILNSEEPA